MIAPPARHRLDGRHFRRLPTTARGPRAPPRQSRCQRRTARPGVSSMGAGVLLTYSDPTVAATKCTALSAIARPSARPISPPANPKHAASPRKASHHGSAGRAQGPHDADLRAPADHRHRDGVVDQKGSDHEGDVAQHPKVPSERGEHAPVLIGARALRLHVRSTCDGAHKMVRHSSKSLSRGVRIRIRSSRPSRFEKPHRLR
jgi:hypothetical protein